jgi:origin recognition complex subunit 4
VVEVTILAKRRAVNSDIADMPASKRNLLDEKTYRSSLTTNNYMDQSEQDDNLDGRPLSPLTTTPKLLPFTKVFTSSRNLRKRLQDSEDGASEHSPPSPKKLKSTTTSRTYKPSLTTLQALPAPITNNLRSPSPASPPNEVITFPASSPSKKRFSSKQTHLPQEMSPHLHPCLNAQKRAILRALHHDIPKALHDDDDDESEEDETSTNEIAFQQLTDVLTGTVTRGEGNSCLLLGPRGSGKTSVRASAL